MGIDTGTIVGAIIGFFVSYFFYRKSLKQKKLIYNTESTVLISETLSRYENLKISYNNTDIKSLISTTVKVKNVGTDTIEPSDFVPAMPIIIKTNEQFLLQDVTKYKITCSNTKSTTSLEKIDESQLKIIFDFLNPKDEITISILHTGDISVTGDLKTGYVKNTTTTKYEKYPALSNSDLIDEYPSPFSNLSRLMMYTIIMCLMLMMIIMYTLSFYRNQTIDMDSMMILMVMLMTTTLVTFTQSKK